MNFDTLKTDLSDKMDEVAKNAMKQMVDDFYDGAKKTKKPGDYEEKMAKEDCGCDVDKDKEYEEMED